MLEPLSFKVPSKGKDRTVSVLIEKEKEDPVEEDRKPAFLKTSPAQETADTPKDAAYIGERPTRAEGGPKAPDDIKEMPAQDGEKPKSDEIVLFDQNRQDGDLSHERDGSPGSRGGTPQPPSPSAPVRPPGRPDPAMADGSKTAPMIPQEDKTRDDAAKNARPSDADRDIPHDTLVEDTQQKSQTRKTDKPPADKELADDDSGSDGNVDGAKDEGKIPDTESRDLLAQAIRNTAQYSDMMENSRRIQEPAPGGAAMEPGEKTDMPLKVPQVSEQLPAPTVIQNGAENVAPSTPKPLYDPAFNAESQPGFKTSERKTRTTGRFSFGRQAAMNVAATPMGRYEAVIYRAVGICWYQQCDMNRDVIVTGTIRIRILVNKKGKVVDLRELSRSGASTVQKSFTLAAIQQAPIPEMPPEVARELVGDKLEMIFDFHF